MPLRLPDPCLVVLVGPTAAGKSQWARTWFGDHQVVSSDRLRAAVGYRNVAHLAKIVATLGVLSRGRALCGIGAAWYEREQRLYGWELPPLGPASMTRSAEVIVAFRDAD